MTILDRLAAYAQERVTAAKQNISIEELKERAVSLPRGDFAFEKALKKDDIAFICECKKASPSKGVIAGGFPYLQIAKAYESAGADCISVLTEPKWFLGSDTIFREIRSAVKLPMLRKDFVVDEYQLYQAKLLGADCILLICALLDEETIRSYLGICDELGLAALVETHNEEEILTAVRTGAGMIGVNNRNLKDFTVDLGNASRLRSLIPNDRICVAESGVRTAEDIFELSAAGVDAVLVGEAMMRAADKQAFLQAMRGAAGQKSNMR